MASLYDAPRAQNSARPGTGKPMLAGATVLAVPGVAVAALAVALASASVEHRIAGPEPRHPSPALHALRGSWPRHARKPAPEVAPAGAPGTAQTVAVLPDTSTSAAPAPKPQPRSAPVPEHRHSPLREDHPAPVARTREPEAAPRRHEHSPPVDRFRSAPDTHGVPPTGEGDQAPQPSQDDPSQQQSQPQQQPSGDSRDGGGSGDWSDSGDRHYGGGGG